MLKYHIFDLDGTLVDSMGIWQQMVIALLEQTKTPYPPDILKILTPLGNVGSVDYLIHTLGMTKTHDEVMEMMDRHLFDEYAHRIFVKPGVKEYLKKLKKEGNFLGVLTASLHRYTDACLKNNGIFDLFDVVWSIEDYGTLTKNQTEIYDQMTMRLECKKEEIVFYDDNILAISTSKKAGIPTVAVYDRSSDRDEESIRKIADRYVRSFDEMM